MTDMVRGWREAEGKLERKLTFPDFKTALDFVNKIGEIAESANHHPDIKFGWGYVYISLTTHSEGKVTDKDRDLAQQIDRLN